MIETTHKYEEKLVARRLETLAEAEAQMSREGAVMFREPYSDFYTIHQPLERNVVYVVPAHIARRLPGLKKTEVFTRRRD